MKGNLGDFSPDELVQMIGLLGKCGGLRFKSSDKDGLVVFRNGRIIYAASSSVRENLGSLLLARNLIGEDQLRDALVRQETGTVTKRLGNVLVDMGALSQEMLEEVIREQFSRIISEFINWTSGEFSFEIMELADHGEVEVDAKEFLVGSGIESTHILLDAARQADEQEVEPPEGDISLDSLIDEISSPIIGGEIVYQLLDIVSEVCERCMLFVVHSSDFQVVGHFGLDIGEGVSGKRLSHLAIPRQSPSILARATSKESPILERLAALEGNAKILESLGGPSASKSVALPVKVGDDVIMVLYGDQMSDGLSTGWLEQLEISVLEVVRAGLANSGIPAPTS